MSTNSDTLWCRRELEKHGVVLLDGGLPNALDVVGSAARPEVESSEHHQSRSSTVDERDQQRAKLSWQISANCKKGVHAVVYPQVATGGVRRLSAPPISGLTLKWSGPTLRASAKSQLRYSALFTVNRENRRTLAQCAARVK